MKIQHYDSIPHTPALRLAVRCWHDLLEAGHISDGGCAVGWDHKAIVAFADDGTPIGVLTWVDQGWANEVAALLGYVVAAHRMKGVQTAMWNALVEKAIELKRPGISASIALDNFASRAAMAANGGEETSVNARFRVPTA